MKYGNVVYQLKILKEGVEVDNSKTYAMALAESSFTSNVKCCENDSNYVVCEPSSPEDSCVNILIIFGKNKGNRYVGIDKSMLKKPDLLPCFCNNKDKWLRNANMLNENMLPNDISTLAKEALGEKKIEAISGGINNNGTRDSVMSVKLVQEVLEPYLGSFGLVLSMNLLKNRIFNKQEKV